MGKGKPRVSESDGKSENEKIRSLKKAITQRDKEILRLKQELKSLNRAFEKSASYMSSQSKLLTVEELIKAAEKDQSLSQAKSELIPDEYSEQEREREPVRNKWADWAKLNRRGDV